MFTSRDMRGYFLQIIEMEQKMSGRYRALAVNLSHAGYKRIFEGLAKEEAEHAAAARELLKFFTESNDAKKKTET